MAMGRRRLEAGAALVMLALLGVGCATPVAISTASPRAIHRYLTQNALSTNEPSMFSLIELRRYDLLARFDDDPDGTLTQLHELALQYGLPPEALFALAELSFLRAEDTHDPGRFGASALYAYAFLFPEEPRDPLDPLDPRSRVAADLYNRALASAFQREEGGAVVVREGGLPLPFGHFTPRPGEPPELGGYAIERLDPVAELVVAGLRNRYRRPGIGAPLAATLADTPASAKQPVPITPSTHLPITAVARVEAPLAQIRSGQVTGILELRPTLEEDTIEIQGRPVALEAEPTAALAAGLTESQFWRQELRAFLGDLVGVDDPVGISGLRPYKRGRIPAVFVHGTASSPGRWADMVNDLVADPRLRHRFAFWFFRYDSGNPIPYSAWRLRDALTQGVARADPSGADPCLRDMVVMGHSQGGLLTKMTAIDAGDRFWRNVSDEPFEETRLSEDSKTLLREVLFVKPLPFVRRVIFMATPHQGSYLAGPQLVRRLAQRLVSLPADVVKTGADLATSGLTGALAEGRMATSIDNMSPGHRFIKALSPVPVAPTVTAHSIIAKDDDEPLPGGGDGVVKYESAHIEGVESELIVRSPHSGMQAAPATVEEVRRILLEHSATSACPRTPRPAPADAVPGVEGPAKPPPAN
jgi:pimeloyl-ACP methyl ester carboxylesterase